MLRNVAKYVAAGAAVVMSAFQSAQAAIVEATHLTPIGTEVSGDASTVFTWVLPIMGTILAMSIGIKLIKRFSSKV